MRIALFITCLADALYPDVGRATVTVLERLGHTVEFPRAQTCCGQMHVNTGYQAQALLYVAAGDDRAWFYLASGQHCHTSQQHAGTASCLADEFAEGAGAHAWTSDCGVAFIIHKQ